MKSLAIAALVFPVLLAHAQQVAMPAVTPAKEATQFDFLVGQWEIEVTPKVSGLAAMIHGAPRLTGTWKAWRAFDGFGVDDELRVVDGSGNPIALSHGQRVYDAKAKRWMLAPDGIPLAQMQALAGPLELLVGPEGGLSERERDLALPRGFEPVALGRRVLRTETAPIVALAAMHALWGDFARGRD